jgi:hypothetical protein
VEIKITGQGLKVVAAIPPILDKGHSREICDDERTRNNAIPSRTGF